jgi:hypothetical protein
MLATSSVTNSSGKPEVAASVRGAGSMAENTETTTLPTADTPPATGGKKRMSRGLLIGLIAVGGVVVAAVILLLVLFLPKAADIPDEPDDTIVTDIESEPEKTWSFEYSQGFESDFVSVKSVSVGGSQALLSTSFDTKAWYAPWYPGYDTDYEDGYAAGGTYWFDYRLFLNDPGNYPLPELSDYYPEGYSEGNVGVGFEHGLNDSAPPGLGGAYGLSKVPKPSDPEGYDPTFTLLDAETGDALWSVEAAELVGKEVTFADAWSSFDVPGSNAVAVYIVTQDPQASDLERTLFTLDKADGSVLSSIQPNGTVRIAAHDGGVIITSSNEDRKSEAVVSKYAVDALDGEPLWTTELDSPATVIRSVGAYVLVRNDSEGVLLTDSDGAIVTWGRDPDADTGYQAVGQSIVRVDADESALKLEGYTTEGKSLWTLTTDGYWIKAGQLFVADKAEDGSYSMLQLIDLATGKDMWAGEGESANFKGLTGVVGDHVVLQNFVSAVGDGNATSDAAFVLDLASGKNQVTQRVGEIARMYLGSSQFYVHSSDNTLSAYAYADGTRVWNFEMGENGGVMLLGSYLAYADIAGGVLHGLAVK